MLIKSKCSITFYRFLNNSVSIARIIIIKPVKINEIDSLFLFFRYEEYPFNILYTPPINTAIDRATSESIILNKPNINKIILTIGNNILIPFLM